MFQIKSIIVDRPRVVIGAASLLLGAAFVLHTATLWWPTSTGSQLSNNTKRSALNFDVERIVSSNVFAIANSSANSAEGKQKATTVSHSEFSLQAIFESSDESRSTAIIAKPGQPPRTYAVGSNLADGISVSSIERDRVYLNTHGERAVLTFRQAARTPGNTIQRAADKLLNQLPNDGKLGQVRQRLEQLRKQSQEQ